MNWQLHAIDPWVINFQISVLFKFFWVNNVKIRNHNYSKWKNLSYIYYELNVEMSLQESLNQLQKNKSNRQIIVFNKVSNKRCFSTFSLLRPIISPNNTFSYVHKNIIYFPSD